LGLIPLNKINFFPCHIFFHFDQSGVDGGAGGPGGGGDSSDGSLSF